MNKNTELRFRSRGAKLTEIVRELDSFPKMPTDYKQYTGIGGLSKNISQKIPPSLLSYISFVKKFLSFQ